MKNKCLLGVDIEFKILMRKVKSPLKQTTPLQICSAPFLNSQEKIFDFKSRDSTFYKAIEKRGHVSSMQLICMTKQKKNKYCHKNRKVRD